MEWMILPLKRYADFSGRSRRTEYWMFQLGQMVLFIGYFMLIAVFGAIAGNSGGEALVGVMIIPFFLLILALFIPNLAVAVRRLHDQDKSGWWLLIQFVPFGGIILLVFMLIEGTPGPNEYGPDPKGRGGADTFA